MTTKNLGKENLIWFIGKVEDRDDPLMLGRVKVRIYNLHPQQLNSTVSTNDIPWAIPMVPINSASLNGVGISPVGLMVGSVVFGFFMDGNEMQLPVIWGSYNKAPERDINKSDVPPEAREKNSVPQEQFGIEPKSPYAAKYPYNKVFRSERGHVIEIDDTPNHERIRVHHKSGTYEEINEEGRRVQKIVGDDFEIIKKDKNVYIQGDLNVTVKGSVNIKVDGTYTVESSGNMLFKAPRIDWNP